MSPKNQRVPAWPIQVQPPDVVRSMYEPTAFVPMTSDSPGTDVAMPKKQGISKDYGDGRSRQPVPGRLTP